MTNPTKLVTRLTEGVETATEDLIPIVYSELKARAANYMKREKVGHSLQATALVNEAYLRLVDQKKVNWQGRSHFVAVAALMMRRVLWDHQKERGREKRGGDWQRVTLSGLPSDRFENVTFEDLAEALSRYAEIDPRACKVVELRFFGGLTEDEVAYVLKVSPRTVRNDWKMARAWLGCELREQQPGTDAAPGD